MKNIDKKDVQDKCRLCGERDETVAHKFLNVNSWPRMNIRNVDMIRWLPCCTGACASNMDSLV